MKELFYIGVLLFIIASCNRPQKLLAKGKDEKAFSTSLAQLKNGKVRTKHLNVFEQSFNQLNARDAYIVDDLKADGRPKLWLEILDISLEIGKRQRKAQRIEERLRRKGFYPDLDWYPSKELMEESKNNIALYYYNEAQQLIPLAQSRDKKAAREAYFLLQECQKYKADFKDAFELEEKMYQLGTTHVILEPFVTDLRSKDSDQLFNSFLQNQKFPKRDKWKVFHLLEPNDVEVDLELVFYFDKLYDGGEDVNVNTCCNTETIEVGTKTERVWNAKDSVYVCVTTKLYEDVSVSVETFHQSKDASLELFCEVKDFNSGEHIDDFSIYNSTCWTNDYSIVSGDRRALNFGCSDQGGFDSSPPSTFSMWRDLASGTRYSFYKKADQKIY